ncbi:MAG: GDSL-type esterase/lipase family protein [Elusimicrobiota bacterium]
MGLAPPDPDRFDHDVAWRRAWTRRHSAQTEIYYGFDRYDPAAGWAVKPDLPGIEVFDHKKLTTDAHGVRGLGHAYDKPAGKRRLVVLGDSFTFGDEVGDEETYPARLQALLPKAEVINLGVHGYGHDQMLIRFNEEGVKYHPDLVLLGFIGGDMPRNRLAFRDYAKPRYELSGGTLRLTNQPVPPPEAVLRAQPFRSAFLDLLALLGHRWSSHQEQTERITTAILDELAAAVKRAGAKLVLVQLPDRPDFASPSPGNAFFESYCGSRDVPCLSLYAHLDRPLVFQKEGHWDPAGHRMMAEGIRDALRKAALP